MRLAPKHWRWILSLGIGAAIFVAAREFASWRPHLISQAEFAALPLGERPHDWFSPDLKWAADFRPQKPVHKGEMSRASQLRIWNLREGTSRDTPPFPLFYEGFIGAIALDATGERVVWCTTVVGEGSQTPSARMFNFRTRRLTPLQLKEDDFVDEFRFTPDGRQILAVTLRTVVTLESSTGKVRRQIRVGEAPPAAPNYQDFHAALSPDGRFYFQRQGRAGTVWDVQSETLVRRLPSLKAQVPISGSFVEQGRYFFTKDNLTSQFYCLDAQSGRVLWTHQPHRDSATFHDPIFSPDQSLCVFGDEKRIEVVEVATGKSRSLPIYPKSHNGWIAADKKTLFYGTFGPPRTRQRLQ